MVQFFAKYPILTYNSPDTNSAVYCRDVVQRVKMRDFLANNFLVFYPYSIKDHDTPEIIASKLYGSPQYHWIVLLANTIVDPYFDWPLSNDNLMATIQKRYSTSGIDGIYYAMNTPYQYQDSHGNPIDLTTYNSLPFSQRKVLTIYDWEVAQNEAKRQIRLLDASYVQQVDSEMDTLMATPIAT